MATPLIYGYVVFLPYQALSSFSSALQSGQLGPLMTQFGLGEDVANAAAQGGMLGTSPDFVGLPVTIFG